MGDVAKDFTARTVGVAVQCIVEHPFDTIKVKLQCQRVPLFCQPPRYSGAMDAVRKTLAAEGPRGLYKGMGAPLASVVPLNAVALLLYRMETLVRSEPRVPRTVNQQVVYGAGVGFAGSFLFCPAELIKCRLQAQSALAGSGRAAVAVKYGGPMDVARHVVQSAGVSGFFKGLGPTLAREVPVTATFLGVSALITQSQNISVMLAAGLAGISCWMFVYPIDVVKSVIQVDDYKYPKYSGSFDAFRKILKGEGIKGLYKGFGPATARLVPSFAALCLTFELLGLI